MKETYQRHELYGAAKFLKHRPQGHSVDSIKRPGQVDEYFIQM